jgi:hypothetical protein
MTELDFKITSLYINKTSDFIIENIIKYPDLTSLVLDNISIDNFTIINKLFDNLNFNKIKLLECGFRVNKNIINIKLFDNKFILYLSDTDISIKEFLINLPQCIEYIYIEKINNFTPMPNDIFINLPIQLKNIEIIFSPIRDNLFIENLEKSGELNCLFASKLPFGCEIIIKISCSNHAQKYKVIYENNLEEELTLILESEVIYDKDGFVDNIIIKNSEYKIKKKQFNANTNIDHDCNYNVIRKMLKSQ